MDELNNNPFDVSEIDRIQAEIDKDLLPSNNEESVLATEQADMASADSGVREIVTESVIAPDFGDNKAAENMADNNAFFRETVKSETGKHTKGKFRRFAALVCIASIFGGLAIGIAIPLTTQLVIPRLTGSSAQNSYNIEQSPAFTFLQEAEGLTDPSVNETLMGVPSFAGLIDSVEPSVVCITSMKTNAVNSLFGSQSGESVPSGGSGIIFDKDDEKLYIVTNEHVVSGAVSVAVSVAGSEEVAASLVGKDADSDLAVISVNIKDLQKNGINNFTIAAFARSGSMRVGDFVIAVGNALGKGNTATFGFVSGVNKEIEVEGKPFTVIQTDAAINPGNSGGPLINLKGEVIGINMVKFVADRVEGTGYALTSDLAMPIIEQIRNKTARPLLGIQGFNMTDTVAKAFSLPMMGIIVETVVPDSGADKAGIKPSDILTSFNGQTVLNMSQLSEEVQKCAIGDTVEVILIRDGKDTITLNVTLLEDNSANF